MLPCRGRPAHYIHDDIWKAARLHDASEMSQRNLWINKVSGHSEGSVWVLTRAQRNDEFEFIAMLSDSGATASFRGYLALD